MTPDFVVKAAFEPGFGHYEVFGLVSTFRDRIFPTGVAPSNSKTFGGGGGTNAWFPFANGKVNFGLHALVGDGVGRYGSAGVPDATLRPNGTLAPIRSYQGLATLAIHDKKWDVYFHAARNTRMDSVHFRYAYGAHPERRLRRYRLLQQLRVLDRNVGRFRRVLPWPIAPGRT